MKLVTFRRGAELRPGIVVQDRILDLRAAFAHREREAGRDASEGAVCERYGASVLGFIERADVARPEAEELLARASSLPDVLFLPLEGATLTSPIPRPPSMRDGYAFRQHVEAARRNRGVPMIPEFDLFPVFYFTNHQAVVGPGPLPVRPMQRERLDFELEAAIVVGRQGTNLRAEEADSYVFGYMIMNDWSARAVQMEEMKLSLGPAKGKDFATGLGPYLVTCDELADRRVAGPRGDRYDLAMTAAVNGRQLSAGNLRDMHWTFAELLERISYGVTVFPGDVIGSGTVGTGCLLELNGSKITDNLWLQPGDQVSLTIERMGTLENSIVAVD